jgi:zinc protease
VITLLRVTGFLTLVFVLAFVAPLHAAGKPLATQVDIPYESFTLDNGLTVLVHSDHSTPTVFVGVWYAVGSKDEPEGKTGFAHLFEHLMFQGTGNRDGEYFSPFTDAGATGMNGTTNTDRTNYYATVPSGALDMALWMESDRMTHLLGAVTQEALDEQRGVVQNEKRQSETRPYAAMRDRISEGVYPPGHPYRHSVIGSMEDLNSASVEDVHEWFKTYYGASNVILVLAGDVTVEDARKKVSHYFAEAPAGMPLVYPKKWVPNLVDNRVESMYDRVGQTRITRVWAIPGSGEEASTLMYLVNDALAANKNSPLRKKLVDELQLATDVSGSAFARQLSGEYRLTVNLRDGVSADEVMSVVDETIAAFIEQGPDAQIVENAKLFVNMFMLGALETGAAIGRTLADGLLLNDDPLSINTQLAWLNNASPEKLRETAATWLGRGYYQLTVEPFPEYVSASEAVDRSSIPAVTASSEIQFPETATRTLRNGMKLVVSERGSIPLVDVSIQIGTGSTAESADNVGSVNFVMGLLEKGSKAYDANELAAAKDKIAMGGGAAAGLESSSYAYRILRSNLQPSLKLAAEVLRNPVFPDEEIEKQKASYMAYLANLQKAPANAGRSLFERAIYGAETPMGSVWTPELVQGISREQLLEFHGREIAPDNMTVFMIGDIDIDTAADAVDEAFGKWKASNASQRQPVGKAAAPQARVILVDYPGAASSSIIAGHAIAPYDAKTWTTLSVMNRALGGGFESRLNMNLREDKGWSYGFRSAFRSNTSGDMNYSAGGKVQTDKTAASMIEVRREIEEFLVTRPATANEIDRIKLNRTRSLPGSYATNRGFLNSMIASNSYGLPFDYAEGQAGRIAAITLDGVHDQARQSIKPDVLTWLVVGDLEKIEEEVRALDYGPVEVWDAFGNKLR